MSDNEHLNQMVMYRRAEEARHNRMRTFHEIMSGPNPLTPDEIRSLINKRPMEYGFMENSATPRTTAS